MRKRFAVAVSFAMLLAACGSNEPTGPAPLANGTYRAKIDGADFNATSAAVIGGAGGLYSLGGGNASGRTVGFAWIDAGPGTYVIGTGATVGTHTYQGQTWSASSAQGSGSIVVTTSTSTRVAGTFSFVLQPDVASGATGTRTVTQGVFDLTY